MVHNKTKYIKFGTIQDERNGKGIVNITAEIAVKDYLLLFVAGSK